MQITLGKYRHYKGNNYEVIAIVLHSETLEKMVVYRPLYSTPDIPEDMLWVRSMEMFFEIVEVAGKKIPRFEKIDSI